MKRRWESGLRTGYGWWLFLQLHIDEQHVQAGCKKKLSKRCKDGRRHHEDR